MRKLFLRAMLVFLLMLLSESLYAAPKVTKVRLPSWCRRSDSPASFVLKKDGTAKAVIAGFPGVARDIRVEGDIVFVTEFVLDPPRGSKWLNRPGTDQGRRSELVFTALRVGPKGIEGTSTSNRSTLKSNDPFGNERTEGGVTLMLSGWELTLREVSISEGGIMVLSGSIMSTPDENGNEEIHLSGDLNGAVLRRQWRLADTSVLTNPTTKEGYANITKAEILYNKKGELIADIRLADTDLTGEQSTYRRFLLSANGSTLSRETSQVVLSAGSAPSFVLTLDDLAEGETSDFRRSGTLVLPEYAGGGTVRIPEHAGWINENRINWFGVDSFEGPISCTLYGWKVILEPSVLRLQYSIPRLECSRAYALFGDIKIPLGGLTLHDGGASLKGWSDADTPCEIFLSGNRASIDGVVRWEHEKSVLVFLGSMPLPAPFEDYSLTIEEISLYPDGKAYWDGVTQKLKTQSGYLTFDFNGLWIGDSHLSASRITIEGQDAQSELKLTGTDCEIGENGKLEAGWDGTVASAHLRDFDVRVDDDAVHLMNGLIALPATFPASLGGWTMSFSSISIPLSDERPLILQGDESELVSEVNWGKAARLSFRKISPVLKGEAIAVRFDECATPGINASGTPLISGMVLLPSGEIDASKATVEAPLPFTKGDLKLSLLSLVSADEKNVVYTGKGSAGEYAMAEGVPEAFTVEAFSVDNATGKILRAVVRREDGTTKDITGYFNN